MLKVEIGYPCTPPAFVYAHLPIVPILRFRIDGHGLFGSWGHFLKGQHPLIELRV